MILHEIWPWAGLALLLACWYAAVRAVRTADAVMPPKPEPEEFRPFAVPMIHRECMHEPRPEYADGIAEWWTPTMHPATDSLGLYDAERVELYLRAIEPTLPKLAHQGSRRV